MAKATLFFDDRRPLQDGTFPVRLRVYHKQYKHFHLPFSFSREDYQLILETKEPRRLKKKAQDLRETFRRAEDLCGSIRPFSFDRFEQELFELKTDTDKVGTVFARIYETLIQQDRIKTAKNYHQAWNSLSAFFGEGVRFEDIDHHKLHEYEAWMIGKGKSYATIGMYLRVLKMLFNEAKEHGLSHYPFGKRRYQIPKGQNIKKALPIDQLKAIADYQIPAVNKEQQNTERYRDFWLFCYLANGMNFKDMARLKHSDIHDGEIIFTRGKTKRSTRSNPRQIRVPIHPRMQQIIDKWKGDGIYLFPILKAGMNETEIEQRVYDVMRNLRRSLKGIAKKLGIEAKVNLMSARHSFAQRLKESGAPTAAIRDALGHTSEATTQNYLDSFGLDDRAKWSDKLL